MPTAEAPPATPPTTRSALRTPYLVLGVLLTGALVSAGFVLHRAEPDPTERTPLPVRCTSPAPVTSAWTQLRLTGLLRAPRVSELSFGRGDILAKVAVYEGQRVQRGELLTALDLRRITASRAQAKASLTRARAQLKELEFGPRAETLDAARASLAQAEAEVALWVKKVQRRERMVAGGVAPTEAGDESEARLAVARAQRAARHADLKALELGTRPERLAAQRALVTQLEGTQAGVESDWEDARMVAPFDGFVAEVRAEVGEVVVPGAPLVRLVEDAPLEAWVGVPTAIQIEPDTPTQVTVEGRSIPARVKAVLPELNVATRTQTVVLTLDRDPALKPGLVGTWRLPANRAPKGWTLPLSALVRGERDTWSVFVAAPEGGHWTVERRRIVVEGTNGERVWISGDVADTDRVIAGGAHRIVPGQHVAPKSP